jgi:hypothetical protein
MVSENKPESISPPKINPYSREGLVLGRAKLLKPPLYLLEPGPVV